MFQAIFISFISRVSLVSLLCPHEKKNHCILHNAPSKDFDQIVRMANLNLRRAQIHRYIFIYITAQVYRVYVDFFFVRWVSFEITDTNWKSLVTV